MLVFFVLIKRAVSLVKNFVICGSLKSFIIFFYSELLFCLYGKERHCQFLFCFNKKETRLKGLVWIKKGLTFHARIMFKAFIKTLAPFQFFRANFGAHGTKVVYILNNFEYCWEAIQRVVFVIICSFF